MRMKTDCQAGKTTGGYIDICKHTRPGGASYDGGSSMGFGYRRSSQSCDISANAPCIPRNTDGA